MQNTTIYVHKSVQKVSI